ncbi:MAG: DUF5361 domain-containing protein [Anaerostipes sp.]|nr:DUF5361 domain-containing protein [Anaerostipes sp.]
MISLDEDALVCDLAEIYGIFDYRALPVKLLATLSCGLRENSRIKMKLNNLEADTRTILLSMVADSLAFIAWSKTEDGMKNKQRPKSILSQIMGMDREDSSSSNMVFDSLDEYKAAWKKIVKGED